MTSRQPLQCIVPPYLQIALERGQWLLVDERFRTARAATHRDTLAAITPVATGPAWVVHTAAGSTSLPGSVVRSAGEATSGDVAVDDAAAGIEGTLAMYSEVYSRASFDDKGSPVSLTVHYDQDYDNAFWDGTQLIFGDGDGKVFGAFTKPVDVLGHEFTHGVTQYTAALTYQGQSGALNESVSDVFGTCLKQRLLGQQAADGDWLIGEGLFVAGINARGLRDMKAPGTAYDDPRLGKDPQPADMAHYVETTDDNGGVHLNSGIPNRAFQLAAVGIGGTAAEGAGRVWYSALTNGSVTADTDFAGFAAATIAAASQAQRAAVTTAWETVGVTPSAALATPSTGTGPVLVPHEVPRQVPPTPAPAPTPGQTPAQGGRVSVRRSGGIAGLTTTAEVDLDDQTLAGDARCDELRSLLADQDLMAGLDARMVASAPQPDRYVYAFDLGGRSFSVPEQHLTPTLSRVAHLVMDVGLST